MASNTSEITVRAAQIEDVPAVAGLIEPYVRERKLLPRTEKELRDLTRNGFVAESDGRVVGFAALDIYSRKLAEVPCLAVAAGYQGRGIGTQLVEACVQCAQENDVLELMVITASDKMLKACGFDYSLPDQKRALFISTRETTYPGS